MCWRFARQLEPCRASHLECSSVSSVNVGGEVLHQHQHVGHVVMHSCRPVATVNIIVMGWPPSIRARARRSRALHRRGSPRTAADLSTTSILKIVERPDNATNATRGSCSSHPTCTSRHHARVAGLHSVRARASACAGHDGQPWRLGDRSAGAPREARERLTHALASAERRLHHGRHCEVLTYLRCPAFFFQRCAAFGRPSRVHHRPRLDMR